MTRCAYVFKNTGGQCEENCKADFELFCPKHKRLEGDRIRKSNQRVREADTKRQKTVASVVDKTTIDRAVATETTRETITYTTELADGGVSQRVCERKVEISHEESVRASNIMQVQKIQTNFESGDPATFLIRKRPSEVVNSWTPVNVMQHTFLEAAGYSRALFDHHSVVNMINDNKTGVFNSFNVYFDYSALNESAIVPECIWTFNFKTSTSVLSHGSDIERFYHCASYERANRGIRGRQGSIQNPLLSRLPYSVYVDMLNSVATRTGNQDVKHKAFFREYNIDREIWSIALTKAVLGVTDTNAQRYKVKSAITIDREEDSYLDIDIDGLDTNRENATTCTFYVRGQAVLTFNTAGFFGHDDQYVMALMFPKYRWRFVEWARKEGLEYQDHLNRLSQQKGGVHSGRLEMLTSMFESL